MTKVCTSAQMRDIDRLASQLGCIPSIVLMENAAISCVQEILKNKNVKRVAVFCGRGNNAGDGFAIARHLKNRGIDVRVYLVSGSDFSADALINFEIISKMGIKITEIYENDLSEFEIKSYDVVVDAIFGTGLNKEITGVAYDVIAMINNNAKYILSVDIPSGINADTGKIHSISVKADKTVTFAAYKRGLLLFPGAEYAGEIVVSDISIPQYIFENQDDDIEVIDIEFVKKQIPKRHKNSHKGDFGKVLIIGASSGLTGAVCLAANACVRSGAGLVTVAVPDCLEEIFEQKLTEPMSIGFASNNGHFDKACIPQILEIVNNYDCVLFGPGIGRSDDIVSILSELLNVCQVPLIIDADGLFALSQDKQMIDNCKCNLILTPHEMEMSRISGYDLDYIKDNRIELSKSYATENGLTLVLKGPHTIVTSPCAKQYININGNCGMATGGSGDVLGGIIAAFTALGLTEPISCAVSVFIHGLSADIAAKSTGYHSLLPTDMILNIANALKLPVE